jgi:ligand-binding sensor domain-containing protein
VACDKGYNFRIDEKLCKERKGITLYNSFNQTLKGDQIFSVYQDSEGDEWILTDKGVTVIGQKKADSDFPF